MKPEYRYELVNKYLLAFTNNQNLAKDTTHQIINAFRLKDIIQNLTYKENVSTLETALDELANKIINNFTKIFPNISLNKSSKEFPNETPNYFLNETPEKLKFNITMYQIAYYCKLLETAEKPIEFQNYEYWKQDIQKDVLKTLPNYFQTSARESTLIFLNEIKRMARQDFLEHLTKEYKYIEYGYVGSINYSELYNEKINEFFNDSSIISPKYANDIIQCYIQLEKSALNKELIRKYKYSELS